MEHFKWTEAIYKECQSMLIKEEDRSGKKEIRKVGKGKKNDRNLLECLFVNTLAYPRTELTFAILQKKFEYNPLNHLFYITSSDGPYIIQPDNDPIVPGLAHYMYKYNNDDDSQEFIVTYFRLNDTYYIQHNCDDELDGTIIVKFCTIYCLLFEILVLLKEVLIHDVSQLVHSFLDLEDYLVL